jgi:hypothetical protein
MELVCLFVFAGGMSQAGGQAFSGCDNNETSGDSVYSDAEYTFPVLLIQESDER